ncbi:MAG TPA: putative metal-binding motif-containing protein [Myxococcaceae bacterium]|nr:putative metal-binding motif-containing protein [Myxococcaceae bacterium]
MKLCRWGLVALCALWVGCADFGKAEAEFCERNPASCAGATVVLDPAVKATCVLLEIRDPANGSVRETRWLPRSGNTLPVEIRQATLPERVELAARPFLDGNCAGGTQARTPNGPFVTGTALFVEGLAEAAPLVLQPGTDGDSDGYVGTEAGGADCNDGVGAVKPGAPEACTDQVDFDCDNRKGCEAATCSAGACFGAPTAVTVTMPSPLTAGTCTSGGTVTLKDANGGNSRVIVDTAVSLRIAPANSVRFYADAACATPVTSVTIPANTSSASFFVQGQLVGNVTVTAAVTGLTDGTQAAVVNPGAGNRLAFQGTAQTVTAGVCSPQPVRIQSQDVQGNSAPVAVATAVALDAVPNINFKFYSDAACTTEVTSVNIPTQMSTASFYFRGTRSGSVSVAITATGFTGTAQAQTITAASPTAIVIAGPVTVAAATCSAAISATLRDPFGNPATAITNTQLNLISSNAQLALFSNNMCTTTASNLTIAQGAGSRDFFVRSTQAAVYSVTANGSGLTNGTVSVTVTAGPPTVLFFTATAQSPLPAGVCSGIVTVQQRDANSNPVIAASPTTVNLSASSQGFEFFTNSTCTGTAVTATSISTGTSTASFYFRGTKTVSNATLTVSVNSLTGTQFVTISAAPPAVLVFTVLPTTAVAGACSQVVLQTQDSFGNPSNVSAALAVSLTPSPAEDFTFHTANNCSAGSTVNQVTMASGQNTVTFYARGTKAGQVNLSATSSGLSNTSGSITITPQVGTKLVFLTASQVVNAGDCSANSIVQVQDIFNNASPVTASTLLELSSSSTNITFYASFRCDAPTTDVVISAGQSSRSFFFKGNFAETVTVTVSGPGLTSASQNQTIELIN